MVQFVIFSLPRSRSAWLSKFLGYRGRFLIGHDILIECKSPSDFFNSFKFGMHGTVETGAVVGWQLIRKEIPEAKFVVIKRPLSEVKASLLAFGIVPIEGELEQREAMLDALSTVEGVETLDYSSLSIPQCLEWLFEHLLELPFDSEWFSEMASINFQINLAWQLERLRENRDDLFSLREAFLSQMASSPCLELN